jgi:hypothetical protein
MADANPPFAFICQGNGEFSWDPIVVKDKKKKKVHPFHADTYRQRRRTSRVAAEVQQMAFEAGVEISPGLAAALARVVIS